MRKTRRQCWERDAFFFLLIESPPEPWMVVVVVVVGFRRRSEEACQVHFGNEPVSERAHVVHAVGSVVNLLQEVFQLLDENALFEPWKSEGSRRQGLIFPLKMLLGFGNKKKKGGESLIKVH